MVTAIGYVALALNVGGNMLLAHKNIWGWVVRIVTNVAWITYASQIEGGDPMVANHAVFFMINMYGLRKWRTKEKKDV